jgi:hypothetical protein
MEEMNCGSFSLHYDCDYGMLHRKGWSVVIDGSYVVQFERRLIVALWKAFRAWRTFEK